MSNSFVNQVPSSGPRLYTADIAETAERWFGEYIANSSIDVDDLDWPTLL